MRCLFIVTVHGTGERRSAKSVFLYPARLPAIG
jgi:hypothetical protein